MPWGLLPRKPELVVHPLGTPWNSIYGAQVVGDVISFDTKKEERVQHSREAVAGELESILELARSGQIKGACYVMVTADGNLTLTGFMKGDECGMLELVGASALLHDYIVRSTVEE